MTTSDGAAYGEAGAQPEGAPADLSQTLEQEPARPKRWLEAAVGPFQRHVLPFLIPALLLLLITAIVVTLGSGLLLLGTGELQIGPIVIARAVVAAAFGVIMIGSGALWLAARS